MTPIEMLEIEPMAESTSAPVLEIEPASMSEEDNKFTPAKPKKSHWWKFW